MRIIYVAVFIAGAGAVAYVVGSAVASVTARVAGVL